MLAEDTVNAVAPGFFLEQNRRMLVDHGKLTAGSCY
jgi:hypothetical protein